MSSHYTVHVSRYLNIYVGMPDVEEGFNITKPISPHEVGPSQLATDSLSICSLISCV